MKSIILSVFYLFSACSPQNPGTSTNPSNGGAGKDPADNTAVGGVNPKNSNGGGSAFAVTDVDQIVVAPGDTVTFSGTGLNTKLKIQSAVGTASVGDPTLQLLNSTTAKYTIPVTQSSGALDLTVSQGEVSQKLTLFSTTSANKSYPIITAPLEAVCSDIKFLDINGTLQNGTRNCSSTSNLNLCVSDGQINCVANSMYTAAQSGGIASKILSGSTVAGVTGNVILPTADRVFYGTQYGVSGSGLTGTLTIPSANNVRSGSGSFGIGGNSVIPTFPDCSTDGQTGCAATGPTFAAALTTGLGSKIVSGYTVAGIQGTTVSAPANCTFDGATGCIAVPSYPAARIGGFSAANVESGYTIAGVQGSATISPACTADGQQNCSVSGIFKAANVSGISTWDLRAGQVIAGINGALKTNCRNSIDSGYFNYDGPLANLPNTGVTTGTALDFWDTVDDKYGWANNGERKKVSSWSTNTLCDVSTFIDVTTTNGGVSFTTCGSNSTCIFKDQISGLQVTGIIDTSGSSTVVPSPPVGKLYNFDNWAVAVKTCAASSIGGYASGSWRLPTQKELMALYEHGIASLGANNYFVPGSASGSYFLSSSTVMQDSSVWAANLYTGNITTWSKTSGPAFVVCVK